MLSPYLYEKLTLMRLFLKSAVMAIACITAFFISSFSGSLSAIPVPHKHPAKNTGKRLPHLISRVENHTEPCVPLVAELPNHGAFIMSSCTDHQGRLWIGSEEEGVFCYDRHLAPNARWRHFTKADGLGDDTAYALCCDTAGNIWCGHDRSGVSVYNNKTWKNFDQETGPLGAHVYAMSVSPVSGDVWIATEAGLARYQFSAGWTYIIAPGGHSLPQSTCMTFNKAGDIVLGTQTDEIVIGRAAGDFAHWDKIPGPDSMPQTVVGYGLPSGQINCLLTAKDFTIWAGTHDGLAESFDGESSWRYWRGADYKNKYEGLYQNRPYDATVSALELMTVPQYQSLMNGSLQTASSDTAQVRHWIAINATDSPVDEMGVAIAVDGGRVVKGFQATIDTSHARHALSAGLYNGEREGRFTYTFSNLDPAQHFMLRLHFAELDYHGPGQRIFSVTANGVPVLHSMDIFDAAHRADTADVEDIPVMPDGTGTLRVEFAGVSPVSTILPPLPDANHMLSQDYITCLAQDPRRGCIYIGHWQNGLESLDPITGTFSPQPQVSQGA